MNRMSLEEKLKLFSLAVENSPSTIIITNRKGDIEYANPRFFEHTGFTPEEAIGKNPRILKSGKTPPEVYENLWSTVTSGKIWRGELLNKKKCDDVYWESASIAPVVEGDGGITHFVGVFENITDRKKIERLKEEFTGTVSHELRTPLSVIRMAAEDLLDGISGALSEKQTKSVRMIRRNCSRLLKIIEDVLDLSRLESGKAIIHRSPIDLAEVIEEAVHNVQRVNRRSEVDIELALSPGLFTSTDPDLVAQVLGNLLDNALRFAARRITVRAAPHDGCLEITVSDDGPGIAEADQKRLFSKFEQIRRPSGDGYKGTGLGLAICKEIVDRLGGKIWVESSLEAGAAFHISLPVA